MDARKEMIQKLSELIQACKDGYRGFWQAAGEVENQSYKQLFRAKAFQRMGFLATLEDAGLELGVKPTREGSLSGKLHRIWMNFRHNLNPHEDTVVLLECRRGEEHALKIYQDIVQDNVLPEIQPALKAQFVSVAETRDTLKDNTEGRLHLRE